MRRPPLRTFPDPDRIGDYLADRILARIREARGAGNAFLLGCPTGRTPRPIFGAMARRLAATPEDLSHVVLAMMDEYLVQGAHGLKYAPPSEPWSCHHFARAEIVEPLNAPLPPRHRLAPDAVWFPTPNDPAEYEARIAAAGGVGFFLLASGGRDGHVAFNPPGSPRESRTRIIPLSEETRRDNLETFPTFGTLDKVPHHGVSVGIATIAESREAAMVLWGRGKRVSLARVMAAEKYEEDWPATLIHDCASGEIICDAEARGDGTP